MATETPAKPKPVKKAKGIYVTLSPEHKAQIEKLAAQDFRPDAGNMLSVLIARNFNKLIGNE